MSRSSYPSPSCSVAKTSGFATVGVASGVILAANPDAVERTVVNDHATAVVYLVKSTVEGVNPTAVVGSGIRLNPGGGFWSSRSYTGAVAAISTVAATNVCVDEV